MGRWDDGTMGRFVNYGHALRVLRTRPSCVTDTPFVYCGSEVRVLLLVGVEVPVHNPCFCLTHDGLQRTEFCLTDAFDRFKAI